MTTPTPPLEPEQSADRTFNSHRLELVEVELVGGGRAVRFHSGLNIVQGEISSGKTTFVRLLRAMLGTVPDNLAPEVDYVSAIRGHIFLGDRAWQVYRPLTTTASAPVEVGEEEPAPNREPIAMRLPAAGKGETYSIFLLNQLSIPAVSVPQARTKPTESLNPVTMTDWLGYCVITGDEIDTQLFGHQHPFRDMKRRWVFELTYGYYDPAVARLAAELRSIELRLQAFDHDAAIRAKFLAETPFADAEVLEEQLAARNTDLAQVSEQRAQIASDGSEIPGVQEIRQTLLTTRTRRADVTDQIGRLDAQIKDLTDLRHQLSSQSARLTRAIVADEWLVDFDFIVCPRCGSDIHAGRAQGHRCYLCLQEPKPAPSQDQLLAEQDRIVSQITETDTVIEARRISAERLRDDGRHLDDVINRLAAELDQRTATFVSDRATGLEYYAAEQARIEADIVRLHEYLHLLRRHEEQIQERAELEAKRDEVTGAIERRELSQVDAEANVRALEERMLTYLHELHIPQFGQELSVKINRKNYMPEIAGRTFDELSSQGLKTLVNIAHALAHHTVAINRGLPLPGLLVLDGLSANAGFEGFDVERVNDVYRLLSTVANAYQGALQLVAVDNELPRRILLDLVNSIVLTLTQKNRLIRIPKRESASKD